MKIIKKIGLLLLLIVIGNSFYNYVKPTGMTKYLYNKNLETIKKDWKGNTQIDGEFSNGSTKDKQTRPIDILKWKISKNPQEKEKKQDTFKLKVQENKAFLYSDKDMIVWLGHATFFIRINGKTFLTDPVLGDVSLIKRETGLACPTDSINGIDYILLSHGHRDHFDKNTLKTIFKNNPNIEAFIPLELQQYFDKNKIKNQQAGWYQKFDTENDIEIYFMPANHWNRRGAFDFNKNLWGSFVLKVNGKTIYFSGDTAYGKHFKEINTFFGKIDYCLMPIGAYKPEYFMKDSHMNPNEALKAFQDLQGKTFIPMHYGTYDLSDEPLGEPLQTIQNETTNYNIQILDIGEEFKI
jgi:L-ascorbate metabolism protein UlaG (beta-lactamase superfamily)